MILLNLKCWLSREKQKSSFQDNDSHCFHKWLSVIRTHSR